MISTIQNLSIRSEHAHAAGFASIDLSVISWVVSLGKSQSKPQADRWGLFVGEWTPPSSRSA